MDRLVLPFPVLLVALLGAAVVNLFQWAVYEGASSIKGKELWAGVCTPQKLQNDRTVELLLLCNGEEVTTQDATIILAWLDEQQSPQCSKEAYWNSDSVSWDCKPQERAEPA